MERPFGTDAVWFRASEVAQFLPRSLTAGSRRDVPAALIGRLARLHLVDNVLGQPTPFHPGAVEEATLTVRVTEVKGDRVYLKLTGATRAAQGGRAVSTRLLGSATYDRAARRFTAFELLAVGERRGGMRAPYVRNATGPGTIGFAFVLADPTSPVDRVAPAYFAAYGWR
jgi:hypothetical protein